jgi:hypothetical protein
LLYVELQAARSAKRVHLDRPEKPLAFLRPSLRANGKCGWSGWPTAEKLEALRQQWFDAPDLASQQALCAQRGFPVPCAGPN